MEQDSWPPPAFLICWRPCTPTKLPEVARHDVSQVGCVGAGRADRRETHSPASLGTLCPGDFRCLRLSGTPPTQRAHQVHPLDAVAFSACRSRHRLGHVPFLALSPSRREEIRGPVGQTLVYVFGALQRKESRRSEKSKHGMSRPRLG